jgi:membrane protease YdiL (CAAX protease family)
MSTTPEPLPAWNPGPADPPAQTSEDAVACTVAEPYTESHSRLDRIPALSHTFLFFALAVLIVVAGELITLGVAHYIPLFSYESFSDLAQDARLIIPSQALQYAALLGIATLLFGAIWHKPFWKALEWNGASAAKRGLWLAGFGLVLGLVSSLASNYLPMPKEAPILNDLMRSSTGAWLMFLFGTTGAPLVEEVAFRGFLLPSLLNLRRRPSLPGEFAARPTALATPGVAVCILLTSAPFALLHSLQVSSAWAPILLIGAVSVILCLVRLWTNSVAASTLVHATYNFTLFAGMLVASDGFRHLEKLNN